jgi:hypothetical protein
MNKETFDKILDSRLKKTKSVLESKRTEYATGKHDRLHNFNRAASMLGCSKENALIGMLSKHLVSVLDMVDNLDGCSIPWVPSVEFVEEKIGDSINYLILLEAMIKERLEIKDQRKK